jgi:hypothetical protein
MWQDFKARPKMRQSFNSTRTGTRGSTVLFYVVVTLGPGLLVTALLLPWKGTVWLKADTCRVLAERGAEFKKLEEGGCAWAGKFDPGVKTVKLYVDRRWSIPYDQVIAYEIKQ